MRKPEVGNKSEPRKQTFRNGVLSVRSVKSCPSPLAFQFAEEPGAAMGPIVVGGAGGDAPAPRQKNGPRPGALVPCG